MDNTMNQIYPIRLFVYGTARSHQQHNKALLDAGAVLLQGVAEASGYSIIQPNEFHVVADALAMIPTPEDRPCVVMGELFAIKPEALVWLDKQNASRVVDRALVEAKFYVLGKPAVEAAWAYMYAGPVKPGMRKYRSLYAYLDAQRQENFQNAAIHHDTWD